MNKVSMENFLEVQEKLKILAREIEHFPLSGRIFSTESRKKIAQEFSKKEILSNLSPGDAKIIRDLVDALNKGHTPQGNKALVEVAEKYVFLPASDSMEQVIYAALLAVQESIQVGIQLLGEVRPDSPLVTEIGINIRGRIHH